MEWERIPNSLLVRDRWISPTLLLGFTTFHLSHGFRATIDFYSWSFIIFSTVAAYVTHSNVKFLLLHKNRSEDSIKGFFEELHEIFIRHVFLNPFYEPFCRVEGDIKTQLDARVAKIGGRWFGMRRGWKLEEDGLGWGEDDYDIKLNY